MSPRPGWILDDITLEFERPRPRGLVADLAFARLKRLCLDLLRATGSVHLLPRLTPIGLPAREPAGS